MTHVKRACCCCGHAHAAHEHYRPGTDCSVTGCGCQQFISHRGLRSLLGALRRIASKQKVEGSS